MKNKPINVFFDANIVIQAGKPPGGPLFQRVVDLVEAGFINVLTTDLTKTEVVKKHVENDYNVIKDVGRPHFRKLLDTALGTKLPSVTKDDIKKALFKKYSKEVEDMFAALEAKTVSIDTIKPSTIFQAYSAEEGFFSGEGKRHQFPDAFIFECLKSEASKDAPLTIVSDDGDFDGPSADEEFVSVVRSIADLFRALNLDVEAPNIDDFLAEHHDQIQQLVDAELNNWGLHVRDIDDAEIDSVNVTGFDFIKTTSFGRVTAEGDVLVVGTMRIEATVSFTHPNWENAMYDSEDKVLIPFEDVSGETEVTLEVEFSLSINLDEDGAPEDFDQFGFTDDNFNWIDLNKDDWD